MTEERRVDGNLHAHQRRQDDTATLVSSVRAETDAGDQFVETSQESKNQEVNDIEDWHDLNAVRDDLRGEYVMVNDLDEETAGYDEYVGNPEEGWEPIGDDSERFEGVFDGNGHDIARLRIDRPDEDRVGLFSEGNADIRNVNLVDVDITGKDSVGALVGDGSGMISLSSASGEVIGDKNVGGLVGSSYYIIWKSFSACVVTGDEQSGGLTGYNHRDIINSWATGDVETTDGGTTGGLVGSNTGIISRSYATGTVTANSTDVGGLVGDSSFDNEIRESYATGEVTGDSNVGGLVGSFNSESEISGSYATGEVTGDSNVGGLVGELSDMFGRESTLRDSYWDVSTTGIDDAVGEVGDDAEIKGEVNGLETTEIQGQVAAENMSALDFEEAWQVVTDPDDYPGLRELDGTKINGIEWRNPSQARSVSGSDDPADALFATTPVVRIDERLLLNESVEFEITNQQTGRSVTVSPIEALDAPAFGNIRLNLFGNSGTFFDEPNIRETTRDINIAVEVGGDEDTFTETTIAEYTVSVFADGVELATSEPREFTIGYQPQPVATIDGDQIVVTTDPSGIDPDRDVEFELYESEDFGADFIREPGTYDDGLDHFVYEFDHEEFESDTVEQWGVTIDRPEDGGASDDETVYMNNVRFTTLEIGEETEEMAVSIPEMGPDEATTVQITAPETDHLVIDNLWTDWWITAGDLTDGEVTNIDLPGTPNDGTVEVSWNGEEIDDIDIIGIEPNHDTTPEPKYIGGEYIIEMQRNNGDDETLATLEVVEE